MKFPSGWQALVWLVSCLWLTGCMPLPDGDSEEKNPLIGDARAKKAAYNYQGAVESLEKALEGNPRLALAHWELGLIFCQNVPDPAAAIYHFEKLLKLRPDWRHAETARQMINVCKIELAKNVPLGPQTPAIQQQIDKLTAKVHELANEANRLRTQNQSLQLQVQQFVAENAQLKETLRAYAAVAQTTVSNPPTLTVPRPIQPDPRVTAANPLVTNPSPGAGPRVAQPPSTPTKPRQHTVQAGETFARIAQRYGLKVRALVLANPNVTPERLKVGQVLQIPPP